jgi:periplasmic divalent cation tolerance protein
MLKTSSEQLAALETRLRELHSYQIPEFLVLDVDAGSHSYLEWLFASLRKPQVIGAPPARLS